MVVCCILKYIYTFTRSYMYKYHIYLNTFLQIIFKARVAILTEMLLSKCQECVSERFYEAA